MSKNTLFYILLSAAITLPLFFKGTYFEKELLPTLIFIYLIFILWSVFQISKRDFNIFSTPVDYLILGMVFIYLLSVFIGVNKRQSLLELSKYVAYFIVFIMSRDLSKNRYHKAIVGSLIVAGLVLAVIGVGTAAGTFQYPDAVLGGRISSTFQYPNTLAAYVGSLYFISLTFVINEDKKVFKALYAFAMGSFLFILILTYSRAMWVVFPIVAFLYFLLLPKDRKLESLVYMIFSIVASLPSSFLFTRYMEDGGYRLWYIFAAAALGTGALALLGSLLERQYRKVPFKALVLVLVLIVGVLASSGIYIFNQTTEVELSNNTDKNRWTSLSRNVSSTLPTTTYRLNLSYRGDNREEAAYIGRVIVYNIDSKGNRSQILAEQLKELEEKHKELEFTTEEDSIGVAIYFQNYYINTSMTVEEAKILDESGKTIIKDIPLKYKYIPESIVTRFGSISSGENSFTSRMRFNIDGLKIVRKYPIFGAGGGGWVTLYQQFQSYPYWTTQAHNFFIQMWIEIGTVGFLLFLAILFMMTYWGFKTYRKRDDSQYGTLIVGLYAAMVAMLGHAVFDFDMSLTGFALGFWALLGIYVSNIDFGGIDVKFKKLYNMKFLPYTIVALSLALGINSLLIIRSNKHLKGGLGSNIDQLGESIETLEKAVKLDILEPSYKLDLANAYKKMYELEGDYSYMEKAIELSNKYIALSANDSTAQALASSFNMSIGEVAKGLELLERSVELRPLMGQNYIYKLDGYLAVFQYYFNKGEYHEAREMLGKGLTVKEQIAAANEKAYKPMPKNNELVTKIGLVEGLYRNIDRLEELLHRGQTIDFAYYFDLDINYDGELDMLSTSKPEGSEIEHQVLIDGQDSFIRITNLGEKYGFKYITPITFQPDTTYVLELEARGTANPDAFNLYAWSSGAENANQGELIGIELTDKWRTIQLEFTTDSDIEPGRQYIRIQHNGNDSGYIDIKDLVIFAK